MNAYYLSEPEIYRPPLPSSPGPTIETYLDRPSIRDKRCKIGGKPGNIGDNRPCIVEVETGRKWKSAVAAGKELGIPKTTMHKALKLGRSVKGKRYEYGPNWVDVMGELERAGR